MTRWTDKAALARTKRRVSSIRKILRQIHEDWDGEASEWLMEKVNDDLDESMRDFERVVEVEI